MSSTSTISHGYEAASELSLGLAHALRDIKTQRMVDAPVTVPSETVNRSIAELDRILAALEQALLPSAARASSELDRAEIPDGLAAWLRATSRDGTIGVGVLAQIRRRLQRGADQLDDGDVAVLEHIERVIDAHAHHAFTELASTWPARA